MTVTMSRCPRDRGLSEGGGKWKNHFAFSPKNFLIQERIFIYRQINNSLHINLKMSKVGLGGGARRDIYLSGGGIGRGGLGVVKRRRVCGSR